MATKTETELDELLINYLSKSEYQSQLSAGNISENEIYMTPDEDISITSTGNGNAVTNVSIDGNEITIEKDSTFLKAHPTVSKSTDSTSKASPSHGGTFTAIDSVTRDTNGHVTKVNTKTVTLPKITTDSSPTSGSENLCTSGGIYEALSVYVPLARVAVGGVKITPKGANQATKASVTFGKTFNVAPKVFTCPVTSSPGGACLGTSVNNITTTGCDIYLTRTDTTQTEVFFFAFATS